MSIKEELYIWRDAECVRKGIEAFRVLPNATLDSIAENLPQTKEELCEIKGIKEMKFSQYGQEILQITSGKMPQSQNSVPLPENETLTVSEYLGNINSAISKIQAKIKGEVATFQASGNAIYFTIKDSKNDAVLSVFMWSSDYKISNIEVTIGLEIIVEGYSEIYKPSGKFSLRASTIELVGEGALKAAYEKLKIGLQREGLFDSSRKIKVIDFPSKIAVITSKQGAVIHDFLNNLGKFGYSIQLVDSRVEGVLAIKEILSAIYTVSKLEVDALVIIRGGGSLESLQAFNNENVVRAIASLKIPVICAIGHDKDIPLAQMVADYSPSTPSMCTSILNESWNNAKFHIENYNRKIISEYGSALIRNENILARNNTFFQKYFSNISNQITYATNIIYVSTSRLEQSIYHNKKTISDLKNSLLNLFYRRHDRAKIFLEQTLNILEAYDPIRQLKLGYSLIRLRGKIEKNIDNFKIGDTIDAELSNGNISATIYKIEKI